MESTIAESPAVSAANIPEQGLLMVAAKALQDFVLGSDRLREMIGATQLIEDFCSTESVAAITDACDVRSGTFEIVTSAAGQTVIRFDNIADARRVAAFWPWMAHRLAPGMEIHLSVQAMDDGSGSYVPAIDKAQRELGLSRNAGHPRDLPPASPPLMRARRSGLPAIAYHTFAGEREEVDTVALAKRERRNSLRREARLEPAGNPIFKAFDFDPEKLPKDLTSLAKSPLTLRNKCDSAGNPISVAARQPCLAVVHADGNGLGQTFIDLSEALASLPNQQAIDCFRAFSSDFRQVGLDASKAAVETLRKIYNDPLPVLPLVLAGDDLRVILRGELAIPFTEAWLIAFERLTGNVLADLKAKFPSEAAAIRATSLSGGAGIAYCSPSDPFVSVYNASERLAKIAKDNAKKLAEGGPVPSSLAFNRPQGDYDHDFLSDFRDGLRLTGMPYYLSEHFSKGPTLKHLRDLRLALSEFPSGSLRQLLGELRTRPAAAPAWFRRMLKVLEESLKGNTRETADQKLAAITNALDSIHGSPNGLWWKPQEGSEAVRWTAIPDALAWMGAEPKLPDSEPEPIPNHE